MSKTTEILSYIGNAIGKPPGWERFVRILAAPEKCKTMPELCMIRDGMAFLVRPSVPVEWHITFFGTYEPELRNIFRVVLPAGGVALDVGANVGWHTLLMAQLVGSGGRVFAAEANPSVRIRLRDNLNLNNFQQTEIIPHALADSEGIVDFYGPANDDPNSGNGHIIRNGEKLDHQVIRVETRQLDKIGPITSAGRLDLIKIDVEGFEWPVLRGGELIIAKFRPHIVFEYDAAYVSRGAGSPELIGEFFRRHQYRLYAVGRSWAKAIEISNWPDCANIWAVPVA